MGSHAYGEFKFRLGEKGLYLDDASFLQLLEPSENFTGRNRSVLRGRSTADPEQRDHNDRPLVGEAVVSDQSSITHTNLHPLMDCILSLVWLPLLYGRLPKWTLPY
jgi:hypothetical protein